MSWLKKFQHRSQREQDGLQTDEGGRKPTPQNPTMLQSFEWHTPPHHYPRLLRILPALHDLGVTSLWLPPGCKGNNFEGNGYDIYDLWDLGEFDQKWRRETKWGAREELDAVVAKAAELGVRTVWDAVLNHKAAGDEREECWAVEADQEDHRIELTRPTKINAWLHYNFPGRGDTYSSMKWHADHFNGTDWDDSRQRKALFKLVDAPESYPRPGLQSQVKGSESKKDWADDVSDEHGNADYLMFNNIDYRHPEAREDVKRWGEWMVKDVGVTGFRLDAVQHYSWRFAREWIECVKAAGREKGLEEDVFVVGEFWIDDCAKLLTWCERVGQGARTYDAPLLYSLSRASMAKEKEVDLRRIFDNTVVGASPASAVTLVRSHDTQPGQASATPLSPFFRPHAYALTLLRLHGLPCVFFGDLYGTAGPHAEPASCWDRLPNLLLARKLYAYGAQRDYFDERTCVGWTRAGTWDRRDGCAVVMGVGGGAAEGKKRMFVGRERAGEVWTDVLGWGEGEVRVDEMGFGGFRCAGGSVSVWVNRDAAGRERFPVWLDLDVYRE
ncbi:hypothetical protein LTR66_013836 [Elasticomyces elasticus]|nr:hypothetical protein LTR66_013836 [Elasticomyces elasticus]